MTTHEFRNVLVTGGAGFIGSNTLLYLVKAYPDINFINIDKLDYCANLKNLDEIEMLPNYFFYKTNINNTDFIDHILVEHKIDAVIHFAAQSHVDNSFGNSIQFTQDNVLSFHYFLESIRIYGKIKKFIHISTDEVYGEVDDKHPGCHEKSLLNPTNPYAATKAATEFIVRSYQTSYGLPVIITRGNNVYGPYQYPEKIIPKFTQLLMQRKKMTIHGKGTSKRTFIHAVDVARAIETILFKGEIGEIYNIGTDNEYTVMKIARMVYDRVCPKGNDAGFMKMIDFVQDRNFNDHRYSIDSSNLKNLGWKEEIQFETGLDQVVKWYMDNPKHWAPV